MRGQWVEGNRNVQIQNVSGSTIQITHGGPPRRVPLEAAVIPVRPDVRSPVRLVRARSGVLPYTARAGLLTDLQQWVAVADPFAACLIGGRGGSGKTRLGVELCEQAREAGWLTGLLTHSADQAAVEALAGAPTARLVIVDYAEIRAEQLEAMLPLLAAAATARHPVRVVLLVRAAPRGGRDWADVLRHRSDALDALVDDVRQWILQELPLESGERATLFDAAAGAFAARADRSPGSLDVGDLLSGDVFSSPLMVVIAAYLAIHGERELPLNIDALLDELLHHEQRYWRTSAQACNVDRDPVLQRRVVALATLTAAAGETEAVALLSLMPDLADASARERGQLARWVHELYPAGPGWWNPLEPDLIAEHLVAGTYADTPAVLSGVLAQRTPSTVVRSLDVFTRAAPDHHGLAHALGPILADRLPGLCELAVTQAESETDLDLLLGETTVAAALNRAVNAIAVEPGALTAALDCLPNRPDLILSPLSLTLHAQLTDHLREPAARPPGSEGEHARLLGTLAARLGDAGRREEGVAAIEEAVRVGRRLAAENPAYEPDLAMSLHNLGQQLDAVGRRDEGLRALDEAAFILRRLATSDAATYEPAMALVLSTLGARLGADGRRAEGLAAIEEAVGILRPLATADPAAHGPGLGAALTNLAIGLGDVGRRDEGLTAIQESGGMYRRLAAANPAAYGPHLAGTLNNLSTRLRALGRHEESLAAIEEAVGVMRRLAAANPAAHEPDLAMLLTNLGAGVGAAGRVEKALAAVEEAVGIRRRLAAANPAAYEAKLASSLNNLSARLRALERVEESLAAIEEAVGIRRRLAAANPAAHEPLLAMALSNLGTELGAAGRLEAALAAIEEAVGIRRRLAAANPAAYEPNLAISLNNLSVRLAALDRHDEGLAAVEEAIGIGRRLAVADPAAYEPSFAVLLVNLGDRLDVAGRHPESIAALEEAMDVYRRLAAANPALHEPALAELRDELSTRKRNARRKRRRG